MADIGSICKVPQVILMCNQGWGGRHLSRTSKPASFREEKGWTWEKANRYEVGDRTPMVRTCSWSWRPEAAGTLCSFSRVGRVRGEQDMTPRVGNSQGRGEVRTFYIPFPDKASTASTSAHGQAPVALASFRFLLHMQGWLNLPPEQNCWQKIWTFPVSHNLAIISVIIPSIIKGRVKWVGV